MVTSNPAHVRRSVVAGQRYPGTRPALERAVDDYVAAAAGQPLVPGHLIGLISPHAGYAYSGATAAHAYRQLEGRCYDTVVLLGPSHREWLGDGAVSGADAYETPLGLVPLDAALIDALLARLPLTRLRRDAEHSLEIQLPFLQRRLGSFSLLPIMLSADRPEFAQDLARALVDALREQPGRLERTLLVASSDLHHIENYAEVVDRDRLIVDALDHYDLAALTRVLMDSHSTVCGRMPILTVLHAGRLAGATHARVLHHTTSGDVTGDRRPGQYTVGYVAAAIYRL